MQVRELIFDALRRDAGGCTFSETGQMSSDMVFSNALLHLTTYLDRWKRRKGEKRMGKRVESKNDLYVHPNFA